MRVLVTGGGGFIGSHVAARLRDDGHEVRVLDSFATGWRSNMRALDGVELIEGDVQSYERAATATRGCEMVLHQAALPSVPRSVQDPLMTNVVNVTGTLNVLLAARDNGVRRVVYASSSSVYGSTHDLPKRESMPTLPISPYSVSKLAGEGYCRAFWNVYQLECVALRYFNVFGPRQDPNSQYSAVIPRFIAAALERRPPIIFGDGTQSRDFTYVDNVVEANVRAMVATGVGGRVFNVACGERISLNALIQELSVLVDAEIQPEYRSRRPGEVPHSMADITLARELLGYQPVVQFGEGLRRTLEARLADAEQSLSVP